MSDERTEHAQRYFEWAGTLQDMAAACEDEGLLTRLIECAACCLNLAMAAQRGPGR